MLHYQVFRTTAGLLRTSASIYACKTDTVDNIPSLDTNACILGTEIESGVYSFNLDPGYYYYYYIDGRLSNLPVYIRKLSATYYIDVTLPAGTDVMRLNYIDLTDIYGRTINTALISNIDVLHINISRLINGREVYVKAYDVETVTLAKLSIGNQDDSHIILEIQIDIS